MGWLFASFYLIPAAASILIFWSVWRLLRLLELTLIARRIAFILLGTLLLAPVLVPAGTIMVAWVPHAVLIPMLDIGYYTRLAQFVIPSFAITATLFGAVSWWRIKGEIKPLAFDWTTLAVPIVVAVLVTGLINYFVPDRDISPKLTSPILEKFYGDSLDDIADLLNVSEPDIQASEVARLKNELRIQREILRVSLEGPSTSDAGSDSIFYYLRDESPPSKSCSGVSKGDQIGLWRCTWSFSSFNELDVLEYTRRFDHGDETLRLVVEFEYDKLLDVIER